MGLRRFTYENEDRIELLPPLPGVTLETEILHKFKIEDIEYRVVNNEPYSTIAVIKTIKGENLAQVSCTNGVADSLCTLVGIMDAYKENGIFISANSLTFCCDRDLKTGLYKNDCSALYIENGLDSKTSSLQLKRLYQRQTQSTDINNLYTLACHHAGENDLVYFLQKKQNNLVFTIASVNEIQSQSEETQLTGMDVVTGSVHKLTSADSTQNKNIYSFNI